MKNQKTIKLKIKEKALRAIWHRYYSERGYIVQFV